MYVSESLKVSSKCFVVPNVNLKELSHVSDSHDRFDHTECSRALPGLRVGLDHFGNWPSPSARANHPESARFRLGTP